MLGPRFAFHYKKLFLCMQKVSLYRGPVAVSLLRVGFSLLGNEDVRISPYGFWNRPSRMRVISALGDTSFGVRWVFPFDIPGWQGSGGW